ncbi:MAG: DNA polymerase III subunit delta [Actinomycetota bacterium]
MINASAYLIVGDDPHLAKEELHKLLEGASPYAIDEFDAESETGLIFQSLETASLFDEPRIAVVHAVDSLSAEAQRQIAEYLQDHIPGNTLIMITVRPIPKIAAAVKKVGRVIEASKGRRSDLFNWLNEQTRKKGLKLTGDALATLIDSVGESREALAGALDLLSLAHAKGARLGPDDISRQFQNRGDAKLFGFIDAVAERKRATALEALNRLLDQGEAPQLLAWNLNRHFRMLLASKGESPAAVARSLGVPPWRAEKLVRQAKGFSQPMLVAAYQALAVADRKMKSSVEPEGLTLERAVVDISAA